MSDLAADITEDLFLNGQLRLRQPKRGHRAGHDAILLAAATPASAGDRIADFGAGVGAAGFAVARRVAGIELVLVEHNPALADLARNNAALNGINARVVTMDIAGSAPEFAAASLGPDSIDAVMMNPPFNDSSRHRPSPVAERRTAHMATGDTLTIWIASARRMLKSGGVITVIWRADGIGDVLRALERGFGSVEILPVHPAPDDPAIRLLLKAVKGGRAPLLLHPGLVLNTADGRPSDLSKSILSGSFVLPLARKSGDRKMPKN